MCREMVETQKFPPAPAEVVAMLNDHVESWRNRKWALDDYETTRDALKAALIKHKEAKEKEARDKPVHEALRRRDQALMRMHEQRRAIETGRAALDEAIQQHAEAQAHVAECARKLDEAIAARDAEGKP